MAAEAESEDLTEPPEQQEVVDQEDGAAIVMVAPVLTDNAPHPRLCYLKKWSIEKGYGFNLHANKTKNAHFIGMVDKNSPADAAGLKVGDKVVEVNCSNIFEDSHTEVIAKIKANADEVKMLVVDAHTETYYEDLGLKVHGDMTNVEVIECPAQDPRGEHCPSNNPSTQETPKYNA